MNIYHSYGTISVTKIFLSCVNEPGLKYGFRCDGGSNSATVNERVYYVSMSVTILYSNIQNCIRNTFMNLVFTTNRSIFEKLLIWP